MEDLIFGILAICIGVYCVGSFDATIENKKDE